MAKKHGIGAILFFSAVSAVAGGVLAYRHREEIDNIVKDMAETLDATEEEGFFTVDLKGDHSDDSASEAEKPSEKPSAPEDGEPDSDFVDLHEEESETHPEAPSAEEDDKVE